MDIAVVAQMWPETYEEVLGFLRAEGLNPVALSDPDSGAHYYPDSGAHYYPGSQAYHRIRPVVYIAVPRDERLQAERSLSKWRQTTMAANKRIAKGVRKDAFGAFVLAAGVGALLFVLGREIEVVIMWSAGIWTVIFLGGFIRRNLPEKGDGGNESENRA